MHSVALGLRGRVNGTEVANKMGEQMSSRVTRTRDRLQPGEVLAAGREISLELCRLSGNRKLASAPDKTIRRLEKSGVLTQRFSAIVRSVIEIATAQLFGAELSSDKLRYFSSITPKLLFVLRGTPAMR